jgi:hypothetical protein
MQSHRNQGQDGISFLSSRHDFVCAKPDMRPQIGLAGATNKFDHATGPEDNNAATLSIKANAALSETS